MRFKISLEINNLKFGNVLPISYQYELVSAVNYLLQSNIQEYEEWLNLNDFTLKDSEKQKLYSISNLYIPKIYVNGDRLYVNVPRIQFWLSVYPTFGTEQFLFKALMNKEIIIGDKISSVSFTVSDIQTVTPVEFKPVMEYQTLSPLVVVGMRPNKTIEYLSPHNVYFSQFMIDELVERWERIHKMPYLGDRRYSMELLQPERRKAVTVFSDTFQQQKVVGFMMKFRLHMAPELHELAYTLGLGDKINLGFGYIELLKKESH